MQFASAHEGAGVAQCALKFFAHRGAFEEELRIYRAAPEPLRRFMPRVVRHVSNDDGVATDPFGGRLQPFIVMERGESLRDRARSQPVDVFTSAQVLLDAPHMFYTK